ncbi:MAG: AtpZ/AtpI family protein [Chitinophagales bacterium]
MEMNEPNSYIRYTSMAVEMLATIAIGTGLGWWLDRHFETPKPYFTAGLSLVFVLVALFRAIRPFLKK